MFTPDQFLNCHRVGIRDRYLLLIPYRYSYRGNSLPIEEFARTKVVTGAPDATVDQLVVKLRDNGVGSVIVVADLD